MKWPVVTLRRHVRELQFWRTQFEGAVRELKRMQEYETVENTKAREALYQAAKDLIKSNSYPDYQRDSMKIYFEVTQYLFERVSPQELAHMMTRQILSSLWEADKDYRPDLRQYK